MLHVTNGDSTAEPLRQIFANDEVLPWRDVLHEGPVPAQLDAAGLREVRAGFLASKGWVEFEVVRDDLEHRDATLAAAAGEVVLWFEHDLYDQLQLLDLLDRLAGRKEIRASLICIGDHPEVEPFHGLGQLNPSQLVELFPRRQPVSDRQFALAHIAWQAFRAPDPSGLQDLLTSETSCLPFLAPAIRRHLEQFPGRRDGLNRSERQILISVEQGISKVGDLFLECQREEEAAFAGDSIFFAWLEELADGDSPLVRLQNPPGHSTSRATVEATVEITATGREVLAGRVDAISLRGIDRWLGGVHLEGRNVRWRWDGEAGSLTAEKPAPL